MDDRHLEKGVNGAEDDDWSSDDENEPIPNGYVLMQNGNDSDDEESSFVAPEDFVPTADTMEGVEGDSEMPRTTTMSILKPLTAEEEAKLRKEAFENFDRNYEAVRVHFSLFRLRTSLTTSHILSTGGKRCCCSSWTTKRWYEMGSLFIPSFSVYIRTLTPFYSPYRL